MWSKEIFFTLTFNKIITWINFRTAILHKLEHIIFFFSFFAFWVLPGSITGFPGSTQDNIEGDGIELGLDTCKANALVGLLLLVPVKF